MMRRDVVITVAIAAAAAMMLCSCGKKQEKPVDFASTWEKIDDGGQSPEGGSPTSAATQEEPSGQAEAQSPAEASVQADAPSQEAASGELAAESGETAGAGEFSYASLVGQEFLFASGAGGWGTVMTVYMDGSFTGNFHDSEMGEMGDDYPNGTVYYCDFRGSFDGLTKVDDYTYKTTLKNLVYDKTPETEEIKDGIRYCYSTAYGLEVTEDLYFYLPGKPLDEIPEVFFAWVQAAKDTAENGKLIRHMMRGMMRILPLRKKEQTARKCGRTAARRPPLHHSPPIS